MRDVGGELVKYEARDLEEVAIDTPSVGGELSEGFDGSHGLLGVFNTSGEAGLR